MLSGHLQVAATKSFYHRSFYHRLPQISRNTLILTLWIQGHVYGVLHRHHHAVHVSLVITTTIMHRQSDEEVRRTSSIKAEESDADPGHWPNIPAACISNVHRSAEILYDTRRDHYYSIIVPNVTA